MDNEKKNLVHEIVLPSNIVGIIKRMHDSGVCLVYGSGNFPVAISSHDKVEFFPEYLKSVPKDLYDLCVK